MQVNAKIIDIVIKAEKEERGLYLKAVIIVPIVSSAEAKARLLIGSIDSYVLGVKVEQTFHNDLDTVQVLFIKRTQGLKFPHTKDIHGYLNDTRLDVD